MSVDKSMIEQLSDEEMIEKLMKSGKYNITRLEDVKPTHSVFT